MYFKSLDYPVIVIDNDYESPRIGGILIRALVEELRSNDQRVLCGLNLDDARAGARTYVAASAVLISIDGSEEVDGEFQRLTAFLREQSARRANLPVFLYGERRTIEKVPSKLLKYIHGFIFLFEDTKSFISRQVMRAAEDYMKNLLPPFFKALIHHAAESNYSWHTPGHAGGVAFTNRRSAARSISSMARTRCAAICRSRCRNWVRCLTILVRSRTPRTRRHATSVPTIPSSSPTAPPPPTRSSGTAQWPAATWYSSTATATSRCCTR